MMSQQQQHIPSLRKAWSCFHQCYDYFFLNCSTITHLSAGDPKQSENISAAFATSNYKHNDHLRKRGIFSHGKGLIVYSDLRDVYNMPWDVTSKYDNGVSSKQHVLNRGSVVWHCSISIRLSDDDTTFRASRFANKQDVYHCTHSSFIYIIDISGYLHPPLRMIPETSYHI